MTDATYINDASFFHDDGQPLAADAKKSRKGSRLLRAGRSVVNLAKSKNTHDFLLGAAFSGTARMGALAIGGAMGASAAPLAIFAAAASGAAMGSYRYYKEYKTESAAGTWAGFDSKKFKKHLLRSTMFSTIGGGASYMIMSNADVIADYAAKKSGIVVEALREAGVLDAVNGALRAIGISGTAAVDAVVPESVKSYIPLREMIVAGKNMTVAVAGYLGLGEKFGSLDAIKQTFSGMWSSLVKTAEAVAEKQQAEIITPMVLPLKDMSQSMLTQGEKVIASLGSFDSAKERFSSMWDHALKIAAEQQQVEVAVPKIVLPELTVLPPLTSEDILSQNAEVVASVDELRFPEEIATCEERAAIIEKETGVPASCVSVETIDPNADKAAQIAAERAAEHARLMATFDPNRFVDAFETAQMTPSIPKPQLEFYIPELGIHPKSALDLMPISKEAFSFGDAYPAYDVSSEMTAALNPGFESTLSMGAPVSPAQPITSEKIASFFEGDKLTKGEKALLARAMDGDGQAIKDLSLSKKLTDSEQVEMLKGAIALGNKQAEIDYAYMEYWGKNGIAADKATALERMRELAEGKNKVARDFVSEWTGEKSRKFAAAAAKKGAEQVVSAGDVTLIPRNGYFKVIDPGNTLKVGERLIIKSP